MNPDYKDMLSMFIAERVEYLLVGAYAVGVHGVPRYTGDIDLWIRPQPENAKRVFRALAKFGAPMGDLSVQELSAPDLIFQIGVAPRRIDIITSITGVSFDEAWPHRVQVELAGLRVDVIGREALIKNKRATGRPKDSLDAEILDNQRDAKRS